MIGLTKKVAVVPLQSEANANYNPFPNDTTINPTDIQAIKSAFLADQDVLAALKGSDGQQGPQGNQGQAGPAGDSVIVRDTDPTDAISSKVGDLYLNTTSGTLYQRSGITQSQFYAAGLQGLVLPNSIWIRKGNLKGATGDKGDKGEGILSGLGHPKSIITVLPEVGTLYLNKSTFSMYQRSSTEFLTPPTLEGDEYSDGFWEYLGNLKGADGADGRDGENSKIHSTNGLPNLTGKNGDVYINTATFGYYVNNAPSVYNDPIPPNGDANSDRSIGHWQYVGIIKGPAGDSVIVRDTDPTDDISSKVGDLYLNTTSGTLYQRSGITQSQFYAAGLQGLVLPNSIWIRKGNLKGATGEKGDKGDGIISGTGHPAFAIETLPPVGTLYINKNTFMMYERTATEYIPGNVPGELPEDYTLGYWYALGSLVGISGTDGNDGEAGFKVLNGTGSFPMASTDIGKMVIIPNDSAINSISLNSLTNGDFLLYNFKSESITVTKTNETPISVPIGANKGVMISVSGSTFTWVEIGANGATGPAGVDAPTPEIKILQSQAYNVPINIKSAIVHVSTEAQYQEDGATIRIFADTSQIQFLEVLNPNNFDVMVFFYVGGLYHHEIGLLPLSYSKIMRVDGNNFDYFSLKGALANSNRL